MPVKQISRRFLRLAFPLGLITTGVLISLVPPAVARFGVVTTQDPAAWVNVRSAPSTQSTPIRQATPGDRVEVLRETQGTDGRIWYLVRFVSTRSEGWVRSDLVSLTGTAPRSLNAQIPNNLRSQSSQAGGSAGSEVVTGSEDDCLATTPFPEYCPRPLDPSMVVSSASVRSPNQATVQQIASTEMDTETAPGFTEFPPENFAPSERRQWATAPQHSSEAFGTTNWETAPQPPVQPREFVFEMAPSIIPERPTVPPVARQQVVAPAQTAYIRPPQQNGFTLDQIRYFMEVALGSEYGSGGATIRKWMGPVRIKIHGNPNPQDLATVNQVVSELRELTRLNIQITNQSPNIDLHFAPESQFSSIEPNYRPRNMGFFWTWWDNGIINRARILISTTGISQVERSHLIREELTQSMGLMRDSNRYRDSIFFQGWTSVTEYSEIDRAIIAMLYNPAIRPGMNQAQVSTVLQDGRSASVCENDWVQAVGFIEAACNFIVN